MDLKLSISDRSAVQQFSIFRGHKEVNIRLLEVNLETVRLEEFRYRSSRYRSFTVNTLFFFLVSKLNILTFKYFKLITIL